MSTTQKAIPETFRARLDALRNRVARARSDAQTHLVGAMVREYRQIINDIKSLPGFDLLNVLPTLEDTVSNESTLKMLEESSRLHELEQQITSLLSESSILSNGYTMPRDTNFDMAIVCALRVPELQKILKTGVGPWAELDLTKEDPTRYHRSYYTSTRGEKISVIAAAPNQMGMPATAVLTTKMIRKFNPRLVAMVGIAAGVRNDARGFGDILTPDCTFDYGAGKINSHDEKLHFSPDPNPISIDVRLRSRLKDWETKSTALASIRASWDANQPSTALRMHVGPLGSGAAVVGAEGPAADIQSHWRKLIGIEMEAYGAHLACQESKSPAPLFFCAKSICDFADATKGDDWQHYAAFTAAQFCRLFVEEEWHNLLLFLHATALALMTAQWRAVATDARQHAGRRRELICIHDRS
jgi:nucleoside phosphorylase